MNYDFTSVHDENAYLLTRDKMADLIKVLNESLQVPRPQYIDFGAGNGPNALYLDIAIHYSDGSLRGFTTANKYINTPWLWDETNDYTIYPSQDLLHFEASLNK
jgi:hypothetical protein